MQKIPYIQKYIFNYWYSPIYRKINWVLRLILGCLFIYAGAVKLTDPQAFAALMSEYGLVPDTLLVPFALGLPAIEVFAGVGVLMNRYYGLEITTGLLVLFIGVLWFGIINGLEVDCGCFSVEELSAQDNLKMALNRDIALILIAIVSYGLRWKTEKVQMENN